MNEFMHVALILGGIALVIGAIATVANYFVMLYEYRQYVSYHQAAWGNFYPPLLFRAWLKESGYRL